MEDAILRIIHIVCGTVWSGTAMFMGFYLLPSLQEAGPSGGAVMGNVVKRGYPTLMNIVSILTVLTGLRIYQMRFSPAWVATPNGLVLTAGLLLGVAAILMGFFVARPTAARAGRLAQEIRASGGVPRPEQAAELKALNARLFKVTQAGASLLGLTVLSMAAARLSALL